MPELLKLQGAAWMLEMGNTALMLVLLLNVFLGLNPALIALVILNAEIKDAVINLVMMALAAVVFLKQFVETKMGYGALILFAEVIWNASLNAVLLEVSGD